MRRPLRWFNLWHTLGWLLVGVIIYLSLTPHPIEINLPQGDKLGHIVAYMSLMLWFAQLYQRPRHVRWGAGFIMLGVALEYIQGWTGYRDFEYGDMAADAVGVTLGWMMGGTALGQLLGNLERRVTAWSFRSGGRGRKD